MANTNEVKVKFTAATSEFNQAIKSASDTITHLRAEMRLNDAQFKESGDSSDYLRQKQALLEAQHTAVGQKVEALSGKLDVAKQMYGAESAEANRLSNQLINAQAAHAKLGAEINKCKEDIAELDSPMGRLTQTIDAQKDKLNQLENEYGNVVIEQGKNSSSAKELKSKMEELRSEIDDNVKTLSDATGASADTSDSMDDLANTMGGMGLMDVADHMSDVADKLKDVGESAVEVYTQIEDSEAALAGYFGASGADLENLNKVVKNVYENGYGESFNAVSEAVRKVRLQLGDLNNADMQNITQQSIVLEDTYGIDMSESLRGVNGLMSHFGISASEAMDYLVAGTQNGLDKTDELGDNLAEYSGKFAEAEYSAAEYFQVLNNGLSGGTYNLDKVNEAINEVTTRLGDGTIFETMTAIDEKTGKVKDGTGIWSKKTEELFYSWKYGWSSQKEVITSIVNDISNATTQQEKFKLASTAFGTVAEDGGMQAIEALSAVGDAYDNVTGKAKEMDNATGTSTQSITASMRQAQDALAPIGESIQGYKEIFFNALGEIASAIGGWYSNLSPVMQDLVTGIGIAIVAFVTIVPIIAAIAGGFSLVAGVLGGALLPITLIVAGIVALIAIFIALYKNWDSVYKFLIETWDNLKTAVVAKAQAIWSGVTGWFHKLATGVQSKFNSVKQFGVSKINALKTGVVNTAKGMVDGFVSKVIGIKTGFQNAIKTIPNFAKQKINDVKNYFSSGIDKIKEKFSGLKLKIPKINFPSLPKISVSLEEKTIGGFNIKVPHIEWHASAMRSPYIMRMAQAFGIGVNGNIQAGGEAGNEMVGGVDTIMSMMQHALSSVIPGIDYDYMAERIALACAEQDVKVEISGREIMRILKEV